MNRILTTFAVPAISVGVGLAAPPDCHGVGGQGTVYGVSGDVSTTWGDVPVDIDNDDDQG